MAGARIITQKSVKEGLPIVKKYDSIYNGQWWWSIWIGGVIWLGQQEK